MKKIILLLLIVPFAFIALSCENALTNNEKEIEAIKDDLRDNTAHDEQQDRDIAQLRSDMDARDSELNIKIDDNALANAEARAAIVEMMNAQIYDLYLYIDEGNAEQDEVILTIQENLAYYVEEFTEFAMYAMMRIDTNSFANWVQAMQIAQLKADVKNIYYILRAYGRDLQDYGQRISELEDVTEGIDFVLNSLERRVARNEVVFWLSEMNTARELKNIRKRLAATTQLAQTNATLIAELDSELAITNSNLAALELRVAADEKLAMAFAVAVAEAYTELSGDIGANAMAISDLRLEMFAELTARDIILANMQSTMDEKLNAEEVQAKILIALFGQGSYDRGDAAYLIAKFGAYTGFLKNIGYQVSWDLTHPGSTSTDHLAKQLVAAIESIVGSGDQAVMNALLVRIEAMEAMDNVQRAEYLIALDEINTKLMSIDAELADKLSVWTFRYNREQIYNTIASLATTDAWTNDMEFGLHSSITSDVNVTIYESAIYLSIIKLNDLSFRFYDHVWHYNALAETVDVTVTIDGIGTATLEDVPVYKLLVGNPSLRVYDGGTYKSLVLDSGFGTMAVRF